MRSLAVPFVLSLTLAFTLILPAPAARAAEDAPTADVQGSADHPLISRFAGSLLVGYGQQEWAATEFPGTNGMSKTERHKFAEPLQLEGRITRLFYLGPIGKPQRAPLKLLPLMPMSAPLAQLMDLPRALVSSAK